MANKVNMDDIARELGISKNTVSLVFRNIPGINEQTRARILEAADRLGYVYPKAKSGDEGAAPLAASICIVIPASARDSSGFFSHIQFGIESEARKHRLNTVISYYDDSNDTYDTPLSIEEGLVSGIITLGRIGKPVFSSLQRYNIPLIMVDHYYEDTSWDYVLSDNFTGGFMAAKYLIEKGHREIGFLGGINISVSFFDRFHGFKKALEQSSLSIMDEYFINKSYEALAVNDPTQIAAELRRMSKLPTAFFCCNDIEAITLIKGLGSIGLRVPDDISVMGFDDIDLAKNFYPELTTIRVSNELMGIRAVQRLIRVIEEKNSFREKLLLSVSLVERQSVKEL